MQSEVDKWKAVLAKNQVPEADRQKRCATCWRGLSKCFCLGSPPTVAEVLRELPLTAAVPKSA
jgi:hypothetical protein